MTCNFEWGSEASPEAQAVLNIFHSKIPSQPATAEQCALLMAEEITGLVQASAKAQAKAEAGGNGKKRSAAVDWSSDSCSPGDDDIDTICDELTYLHPQGYSDDGRAYLKAERKELSRKTIQVIQEDGLWADAVRAAAREMLEEAQVSGSIESVEP